MSYRTGSGQPLQIGNPLGSGGEGDVFEVTSPRGTVLKKYRPEILAKNPTAERKVRAMVASPPAGWCEARTGFVALAWPSQIVLENGRFVGFLMPAVDIRSTVELHRVANPSDRRTATQPTMWLRGFGWNYLIRTAANLAQVTQALHGCDAVVGDFNEKNIRVTSQARVTLIDCDSMQVTGPGGEPFFCRVGRPEFTPPELLDADWARTFRHPSSDLFALAIHVYQLLMEGEHPFRGIWSDGGEKPSVPQLARQGIWAHQRGGPLQPRPAAVDFGLLPDRIQEMFRLAFEQGAISPARRPSAHDWLRALTDLAAGLRPCPAKPGHLYSGHLNGCPWCRHEQRSPTATGWRETWTAQRPSAVRRFWQA
jgi:DNA-binding helix-hairpin-helix protein with protein kinase domain